MPANRVPITNSRTVVFPSLRDIAAVLFRHSGVLTASFFSVFLAILIYTLLVSPRYEAHLKVLLRRGRTDPVVSPQASSPPDYARNEITEAELNSELELLRDPDLLKSVVEQADLVPGGYRAETRSADLERASRRLASALSVEALRKSNLIQVRYRSREPEKAAQVLNVLSRVYVGKHTELQRPSGEVHFFEQQTANYRRHLQEAEEQVVHFTHATGVASAALQRDVALQKLGEAEAGYRQIELERAEVKQRISALRQQLASLPPRTITSVRSADNPELLQTLKGRLHELQLKRTALLTRFEPSYRLVKEVEQQISETRQAIIAEGLTPVKEETTDKDPNYEWTRMELEKSQVRWEALQGAGEAAASQIASLRSLTQQMQTHSVAQQNLMRSARAAEENYLLYLRKLEEARIGDALDETRIVNVAVVQPPGIPALPVHSALICVLLALAVASPLSIAAAFAAEYLDSTIRTPEEVRIALELPVLAWLPDEKRRVTSFKTGGNWRHDGVLK